MKKLLRPFFLCLFILVSCESPRNQKVDANEVLFKTDDASELFFKNMRQSKYDLEEMEAAKLNVYRYSKRVQEEESPIINLALVHNWRYDEAYVLVEPNSKVPSQFSISWRNIETETSGIIEFENGNKESHAKFAGAIYDKLQQDCAFELINDEEGTAILTSSAERDAFRITVFDFYRLTRRM